MRAFTSLQMTRLMRMLAHPQLQRSYFDLLSPPRPVPSYGDAEIDRYIEMQAEHDVQEVMREARAAVRQARSNTAPREMSAASELRAHEERQKADNHVMIYPGWRSPRFRRQHDPDPVDGWVHAQTRSVAAVPEVAEQVDDEGLLNYSELMQDVDPTFSDPDNTALTADHAAWMAAIDDPSHAPAPSNRNAALKSAERDQWLEAERSEMNSIVKNGTFKLVSLPTGRKPLRCHFLYKKKFGADGELLKFKVRLVVDGSRQQAGLDYTETYAPVVKMTTMRLFLSICAFEDLEIHQMDVPTAFLRGDPLKEEIYMMQPPGFHTPDTAGLVCLLIKPLYGLKQAPRNWNRRLDRFFQQIGFTRLQTDHGLYIKHDVRHGIILIAVYVDDTVIGCKAECMQTVKDQLKAEFEMSDMGELKYVLGMKVQRDGKNRWLYLSQEAYIDQMLEQFGMTDCKPASTPLDPRQKLVKAPDDGELSTADRDVMDNAPYREMVGSLMYLMVSTRPDIAFAVGAVSRFASCYRAIHFTACKHILRYAKGTKAHALRLGGIDKTVSIHGMVDADWAGNHDSRKSTTGYVFMLGQGAISWQSKLQTTTALSTCEAEYMGITLATKEAIFLSVLLQELGYGSDNPVTLYNDNQGAIALTVNPGNHQRSKHIDIRHHFIREHVENGKIAVQYCPTEQMTADVLTKALAPHRHKALIELMGVIALQVSFR